MEVDDKELWERLTVVEQSTKSAHQDVYKRQVVFGKIIELPNLKIQFTSKIILTKDHIKSLIDLYLSLIHILHLHD